MRNKKMAELIRDASVSPIGSTPRKRAQKIVSIMKKVGAIDGSGGPGVYSTGATPETMAQLYQMSGEPAPRRAPAIFPAPPSMRFAIDGKGGPGPVASSTPQSLSFDVGAAAVNPNPTITPAITAKAPLSAKPYYSITGSSALFPTLSKVSGMNPSYSDPLAAYQYNQNTLGIPRPWEQTTANSTPKYTQSQLEPKGSITPPQPTEGGQQTPPEGFLGGLGQSASSDPMSIYYDGGAGSGDGSGMGEYETLLNMLGMGSNSADPYAGITNPTLHDSVSSNMGASAFAYKMMNDPKLLRSLPGFENVPEDALPYGASLAGQVQALAETLRKESGIDSMMSEYMKRLNAGATIQEDLTDYIRGRDEFLNETQGLIDNFKDQMTNMDMANPVIAQRAKQYNDYLYTLKGRQNKRYIEFLNASVKAYETDMTNRKQAIDMVAGDLQREIEFKSTLTIDEFNRYYSALSDMYTQASGLPELEASRAQAQATLVTTMIGAVKDSIGSADTVDYSENYRDALKYANDTLMDKDGNMLPSSRNFASVMIENGSRDSGVAPEYLKAVTTAWERGMQSDFFNNAKSTAEATQMLNDYLYGLDQFAAQFGASTDSDVAALYNKLKSTARGAAADAIKKSLVASGGASEIRSAVEDLTRHGWFKKTPSRDDFLNSHTSANLDRSFLDKLYSAFEQYIADNNGNLDVAWQFYTDKSKYSSDPGLSNINDQDLVNNILANIAYH